jgi:CHAT domain-containing protein/Tfp pilus assembly protein PilF
MPLCKVVLSAVCLLAAAAGPSGELRESLEEFVSAFRAGNAPRLTVLWSEQSPSLGSDRKRVSRLVEDGADIDLAFAEAAEQQDRGVAQLELRRRSAPATVLEVYELQLRREEDGWHVWSLTSVERDNARRVLDATAEQRPALLKRGTRELTQELLHLGAESMDAGEVDRAHAALTAAEDLARRYDDPVARSAAARGLCHVEYARGDLPAATSHCEAALNFARSSGDRRAIARSLSNLSNVDSVTGDYTRAEDGLEEALDLYRMAADKVGEANTFNALGILRSSQGDSAGGSAWFEKAEAIYREINDLTGLSNVLNNLGANHSQQGEYAEALSYLRQALQASRSVDDVYGAANALGNMGNVLNMQGRYLEALAAYEQCLAAHERLGNLDTVSTVLAGIGMMYQKLGNRPQAVAHLEKSVEVAGRIGFKYGMAIALHNLASVWSEEGDHRRALTYYEKSLAIDTELENRSGIASALSDIGRIQAALGNLEQARQSFDKSLAMAREINDQETLFVVFANQAEMAEKGGELEKALDDAGRALELATHMGRLERQWPTHAFLGRIHRKRGELTEARAETERAVAMVEELRRGIPGEEMSQQAFEKKVQPYHEMVGILLEQGDVGTAFEYAERAKARVLLDVLRHGRTDVSAAMTDAERAREKELLAQVVNVSRELRDKSADPAADTAALAADLRKARLDHEAFFNSLYAAHPQLRIEQGDIAPIRAREAGQLLGADRDSALVEFVVAEEMTYLFVLARGADGAAELTAHTIKIAQKELEEEVRRFRDLVAARDLTYAPAARALYDRLLRPAETRFRRAKEICIVADGVLWELPFQALMPAGGEFVLDRHALFYAPSAAVLREILTRQPRTESRRLLAFANPVVPAETISRVRDVYRDVSMAPLPQTEEEIRRIASLYGAGNSRVYVRADAREEVVKKEAGQGDVLHFATHGIFDDQNAMDSRLLLSPSSSGAEDGFLEAREIMRLSLQADLAVLSACETARGRVGAGEGLIGMSWALLVAGCPTSVVSQWKVSSASTTHLMIDLHRGLRAQAKKSKAEALRQAALRTRATRPYRHPFYWAAFVVVGNGR